MLFFFVRINFRTESDEILSTLVARWVFTKGFYEPHGAGFGIIFPESFVG